MNPLSKYTCKDIPGYHKSLSYLSWNNNGDYLAAIVNDRSVRISQYDSSNGSILSVNSIPTNVRMTFLCWNPQETGRLAMCSDEKPIEIWDHRGSRSSMKLQSLGYNLNINWSPDGNYIVAGNSSNNVIVWDIRTGNQVRKRKFNYEVNELVWTSNSDYILAATMIDNMGSLDVISFQQNDELEVISSQIAHSSTSVRLQVDRTFQHVALTSHDQSVTLWDLTSLTCQHTLTLDSDIRNVSFSGTGDYLAILPEDTTSPNTVTTNNNNNQIIIVNTMTGEPQSKIPLRNKASTLAWHPTQPLLVVNQDDRTSSSSSSSSSSGSPIFLKAYSFPFLS